MKLRALHDCPSCRSTFDLEITKAICPRGEIACDRKPGTVFPEFEISDPVKTRRSVAATIVAIDSDGTLTARDAETEIDYIAQPEECSALLGGHQITRLLLDYAAHPSAVAEFLTGTQAIVVQRSARADVAVIERRADGPMTFGPMLLDGRIVEIEDVGTNPPIGGNKP